jgi:hypothetical protein
MIMLEHIVAREVSKRKASEHTNMCPPNLKLFVVR